MNEIRSEGRESFWDRHIVAARSSMVAGFICILAFSILAIPQVASSLDITDQIKEVSLASLSIGDKVTGFIMIATVITLGPLAWISYREKSASLDKNLSTFARFVYIVIDCVRPIFKVIEFFIDKQRTRCFSLKALHKKVEMQDAIIHHEENDDIQERIKKIYDSFCDIHRGKPHGFGTCYVRTYAMAQTLLTGKKHTYAHTLRATLDPINYETHFNAKTEAIENSDSLNKLENGTLLIFSRPLTDKFSNFFNKLFKGTSSQLSHVCNGIVLDGKIYVLEMSHGKLKAAPPVSAAILEPLEAFQSRMVRAKVPKLNLFLPVGTIHPSILVGLPKVSDELS